MTETSLEPQTIFITGANRGIGLGFVKEYLKNGDRVIATCRHPEAALELNKLRNNYSDQLIIERLDVTNANDFDKLAAKYHNSRLDILINNAGIYPENHSRDGIKETNATLVLKAFEVNALGAYHAIQKLFPLLLNSPHARIINLSSQMGALTSADGFGYAYRMSKVALNMLTKCFAIENSKIITISLRPGWVKTEMGGTLANIEIQESVKQMIKIIANLDINDSGKFLDYQGNVNEW